MASKGCPWLGRVSRPVPPTTIHVSIVLLINLIVIVEGKIYCILGIENGAKCDCW